MDSWVQQGLLEWQDSGRVEVVKAVSGGDINEAYYVRTSNQQYFVKRNEQMDRSFFEIEAEGLKQIRATKTIHVPKVYGIVEENNIPTLWLEWIEGERHENSSRWLGERLAALHLTKTDGYGFKKDTYIGKLLQKNSITDNWITYYRDYRLMGQLELGRKNGLVSGNREKMLVQLMENLDKWIPKHPFPSILHGDLWGGNWLVGQGGNPYLIDASVLYGDHEMELAFTELFGGFSKEFYEVYHSLFPLSPEYQERKDIYQLFYLLVHLNMFGETYGRSVDSILAKYVK